MEIETFLERSLELEWAVVNLAEAAYPTEDKRVVVARNLCMLSFEHGNSARLLIEHQNLVSAFAVIRLQYEAITRAIWLLFAATDLWVDRLQRDLTPESAEEANKLPLLAEMLKVLGTAAESNSNIKEPLRLLEEFRLYSWKPLSSFVHGGLHALKRAENGFPHPLLEQAIKASNGLLIMAGMITVILSGNPILRGVIPAIQRDFQECLPPEVPRAQESPQP